MNGEGGEGGGGAGGGDEDPSRLRVEKVGISALPKDITRRLPEVGGGDRRWQSGIRGGGGGGGSTSANATFHCHSFTLFQQIQRQIQRQ